MKFTKMQGAGNDYVYVDALTRLPDHPELLAPRISDRHFGIGSDGLILICSSEVADFRMRMFNADGSESEMCGNGIRCVAKFVFDNGLTDKTELRIETGAGVKDLRLHVREGRVERVTVDMGCPEFRPTCIPVASAAERFVAQPVRVRDSVWPVTAVSMGNPHAVIFTENIDQLDLQDIGPLFEHHPLFPRRANVEFVEVGDNDVLRMRVWERGAGETLACGTGACAAVAAAVLNGCTGRRARVHLRGGELDICWDAQSDHLFMTGEAVTVFTGEYDERTVPDA